MHRNRVRIEKESFKCTMISVLKIGLPVFVSGVACFYAKKPLLNDSKRNFYGDNTGDIAPGNPLKESSALEKLVESKIAPKESFIEKGTKVTRIYLQKGFSALRRSYVEQTDQYFRKERQTMRTISSLHDKREQLWPNTLYILTGFLTGVVFTRRSSFILKGISPVVCGITAYAIFMPSTFKRSSRYILGLEKNKLPGVYDKQAELASTTEELIQQSRKLKEENIKLVNSYYDRTRKSIGDAAGLSVDVPISDKKV